MARKQKEEAVKSCLEKISDEARDVVKRSDELQENLAVVAENDEDPRRGVWGCLDLNALLDSLGDDDEEDDDEDYYYEYDYYDEDEDEDDEDIEESCWRF
jgi:hypothetical protein